MKQHISVGTFHILFYGCKLEIPAKYHVFCNLSTQRNIELSDSVKAYNLCNVTNDSRDWHLETIMNFNLALDDICVG